MENKDFLDGWREANFTSLAGESEYDPTVAAIKAYLKAEEEKKKQQKKEEEEGLTK